MPGSMPNYLLTLWYQSQSWRWCWSNCLRKSFQHSTFLFKNKRALQLHYKAIQKRSSPQTSLQIFSITWLPLSENFGFSVFLQMNALNICARVVSGLERERPLKKQNKPWFTWLSLCLCSYVGYVSLSEPTSMKVTKVAKCCSNWGKLIMGQL